ncbi:hypothetical protein MKX03_025827 [Papaver bracteatum]|nr:hypothetical protein MKX03_025827 [Papaver bracteatum]
MEKTSNKRRKLVDDDGTLNGSADKKEPSMVEEAPYVIVVHGPPKVGKSLLIKSLINHYTKQNLDNIQGPITVLTGNRRRIQFVECPNNMNSMIDAAKYADAVILLIDANYGFEMVHIAGVGDYSVADITILADPCPLPPVHDYDKKMQINIVHNDLDEEYRFETDSFRLGTYLRFSVLGVPLEMVANHNPCQPILVGGMSRAEDNVGHMQVKFLFQVLLYSEVRLTRHSWHTNRLKTKDPIIVSVGWRRYQTTPIYYQDSNGRHEMLEYTPEDQPCLATFWGPVAPSGAGVVAVWSLADNKAPFRILATAELLDLNHTVKIVKKVERIGTPCLILNETALIKDMFTSDDEVDRFRDVKVETACGIQGEVNEVSVH